MAGYLETYECNGKTISDFVIRPRIIQELNNNIDKKNEAFTIDLKYLKG